MQALSRPPSAAGGFSLLELIIVLTLMCVLSVSLWGFGSGRRQQTAKVLCQNNIQKIYIALQIYAKDSRDELPAATNAATSEEVLDALVPHYSADTSIFICPGGRDSALTPGASLRSGKISYAYYMGQRLNDPPPPQLVLMSDRQVNTNSKLMGEQVFSLTGRSPGNNHHKYGGNFLMGDGAVSASTPLAPFSLVVTQGVLLLNPKP